MPDDHPDPASPTLPRSKQPRPPVNGLVRGRTSPIPGASADQAADGRPPTKRARKAINCEPCRNSKLKCDRNRPCSSCVLRGTSASCYQDARGHDSTDPLARGDDPQYARIDPAQEIARLRHSISLLEAYVFPNQRPSVPHRRTSDAASLNVVPKKEFIDLDVQGEKTHAPGMLGTHTQGGLYAGPTSAATHLLMTHSSHESDDSNDSRHASQDHVHEDFPSMTQEYDRDLLALLPSLETIDGLISYYFEYCNWIYRHINQTTFLYQWEKYKTGTKADRIVLSTACAMMAIATHYLPSRHHLTEKFQESHEEMGTKFFEVSGTSLQRRNLETRSYTLELVELLLARAHFQTLSKADSEEIWQGRGELVTIGTAMGLHRDPGKWKMHRDVAERRRWAWWHIILLERWQAFSFGRPICIAAHHFDTQLPSYVDPALDKSGRLYLPNIALFRLAFILGDIMDDAVSVRPVPYEHVQANDRALTQWMDSLPKELDLDEYRIARSLASDNIAVRRLGVQSVIIRASYLHIRFTLHRPYTHSTAQPGRAPVDPAKTAQSLEIAVGAADKLITMVGQSRPDFLANTSLAVPGHMNWGPFHCFSAAMFFSFQLIANPDQPGAGLFRASIRKAIGMLEQCKGIAVAEKAYDILQALAPLYAPEFPLDVPEARDAKRAQVLGTVRKLAFPYHDSHDPRRFGDSASPGTRAALGSPATSSSLPTPHLAQSPQAPHQALGHQQPLSPAGAFQYPMPQAPQNVYPDVQRYSQYVQPVEHTMWGASVGFDQGEWTQFLDGLRPESAMQQNSTRHLQTS
ncbi:hypothetical protein HYPSUDRAFT_38685 [Hypholoma sublateritium FD-334 SS-4]|uniref:Zn(2)-C6 fungal-type domain-containing protein n=1 Tax=Hypholoma sublateritium (strain FD-334 SS-4) TaxID=945553 RepID=A0A0D2LBK3_HYPSF|nr:hypothetical protein HYPSUDRAFT_38685 [Hypholoma sublateritium FD-334 SS-4]